MTSEGASNGLGCQAAQRAPPSERSSRMFHSRHPNYKNALRALFLYRVNKCMVEKTVRLSLDQWFSKGGPWTCFHHLETCWK